MERSPILHGFGWCELHGLGIHVRETVFNDPSRSLPNGDTGRLGQRQTSEQGSTAQYPCARKSASSSKTNSRSACAEWCEPRSTASSRRLLLHGPVVVQPLAPRRRRYCKSLEALCRIPCTAPGTFDSPRKRSTTFRQPYTRTSDAVASASLPRMLSAAESSEGAPFAGRTRPCQGGAVSSPGIPSLRPVTRRYPPGRLVRCD